MITVCCLFVAGEYPYTADYVIRLEQMVRRWIDRPFRFVCLTDRPWLFSTIETIPVQKLSGFAPWTKLELFNPKREWDSRMLYLDLDSLIVAPLGPIIDYPAEFALTDDPPYVRPKTRDSFHRLIVRKFNSSVMVWDGGTQTHLYEKWTPGVSDQLSGDQDWIGVNYSRSTAMSASAMPRSWFPRLSEVGSPPFPTEAKVILAKVPKNHVAVEQFDWFGPLWGAA